MIQPFVKPALQASKGRNFSKFLPFSKTNTQQKRRLHNRLTAMPSCHRFHSSLCNYVDCPLRGFFGTIKTMYPISFGSNNRLAHILSYVRMDLSHGQEIHYHLARAILHLNTLAGFLPFFEPSIDWDDSEMPMYRRNLQTFVPMPADSSTPTLVSHGGIPTHMVVNPEPHLRPIPDRRHHIRDMSSISSTPRAALDSEVSPNTLSMSVSSATVRHDRPNTDHRPNDGELEGRPRKKPRNDDTSSRISPSPGTASHPEHSSRPADSSNFGFPSSRNNGTSNFFKY